MDHHFSRRTFIRQVSILTALHAGGSLFAGCLANQHTGQLSFLIRQIRLQTSTDLDVMKKFYGSTLGLPVTAITGSSITVTMGASELVFQKIKGPEAPFYHFAMNIPENKLEKAREWMRGKAPLIIRPGTNTDIFHFSNFNAHSIFFLDPAGNIVEFIARHDLPVKTGGDFKLNDILNISEIGLVVDDVPAMVNQLNETFSVPAYCCASDMFTAVGGIEGLAIVVKRGRPWAIVNTASEVFPVSVQLVNDRRKEVHSPQLKYTISSI